jgi:hypothetical protein
MSSDPAQQSRRVLVAALVTGGFVAIAVGVFVGIWLGPAYFAVALVGLVDFALAWMFSSGRINSAAYSPHLGQPPAPDPDRAAHEATDDPSYNPYARED